MPFSKMYCIEMNKEIVMKYTYSTNVKDDAMLRESFNQLTQKVFHFDFIDWYQHGHWGDKYIPHVLLDNSDKVISNVSVNLMKFNVEGEVRNYIQLGTVMTDPEYRGQGLNKSIMERILDEYWEKVDGIYLFGNDSVLNYYPKFGFRPSNEFEYSLKRHNSNEKGYLLEKIELTDKSTCEKLYGKINKPNPNDAFLMCDNLGLYQFWITAMFKESIYYLPDIDAYVIADVQDGVLMVYQTISCEGIDMERLAGSFQADITDIKLGFTPMNKGDYNVKMHKEEDCTLFILGDSLENIETKELMFPILSHA